jgi:hypothetical protein
LKKQFKNNNVGGNKIFNYRGVGLSRTKLTNLFRDYIRFLEVRVIGGNISSNSNYKEMAMKLPPVSTHVKSEVKTHEENYQHSK